MDEKELQKIKKRALYLKVHLRHTANNHKILRLVSAYEELQTELAKAQAKIEQSDRSFIERIYNAKITRNGG